MRELNYETVYYDILNQFKTYIECHNLKSMILGFSGGLDSTVVGAIAHQVAQQTGTKLIGVMLPSDTNEESENISANTACTAFSDIYHKHNITDIAKTLWDDVTYNSNIELNRLPFGNVKARLRMIYLYTLANMNKGIVLDTDNKTEHLLAFYTIFGDQGDFVPLFSLWKSEVYKLAEYLRDNVYADNKQAQDALQLAIDAVPTDGNGVKAGGDMAQIAPGYTYEDVDNILDVYINHISGIWFPEKSREELTIEYIHKHYKHIPEDIIMGVINRHKNSAFKRQHPFRITLTI